jgi:deoxyribodipyrimidine photo-lyase
MKKWKTVLEKTGLKNYKSEKLFANFYQTEFIPLMPLREIGFHEDQIIFPSSEIPVEKIKDYERDRDIPSVKGTSQLSVHLRFGTISIRNVIHAARSLSDKWLGELIWREFYMMLLWHFPHITDNAFKPGYNFLPWRHDEMEFSKWCSGNTGYPIVDAGMRELNNTGFMHNRLRMITSVFLTKYLLIDWRWGESYFASKLLDYELASNNGGWQWSAGTGADAVPYFRLFNMSEQTKRFDPDHLYIQKWVPEYADPEYPLPMIDYHFARERCFDFFKKNLQ